jgi:hypothetical protein
MIISALLLVISISSAVADKASPFLIGETGIHWHYERMPEEKHSTIFHPAALKAFRDTLKPTTR